MTVKEVLEEIKKFSKEVLFLGNSIEDNVIENFEFRHNLKLPTEYKILLKECNGIELMGTVIYGLHNQSNVYDLEKCYLFEHFEVENKMPAKLIPFSPDGSGNHYCFDMTMGNAIFSPIIFWQHDYAYTRDDIPEIVYGSLADWMKEVMIDWTLEDYNYDGSEKL